MSRNKNGFTLVELAIVLMIIGLLIGGILKGQELIQNARINTVARQVTAYKAALITFQDSYGALPGDMANAQTRIPNCTGANNCANGNGNNIVGAKDTPHAAAEVTVGSENGQFWKHLAMANLISGIDTTTGTTEWGKSNPSNPLAGGFFVRHAELAATEITVDALILLWRRPVTGEWATYGFATSGKVAAQLDRKMDNSIALTGDVFAISGNWTNGCGRINDGLNGPNGYAEGSTEATCDMMFKIP